MNKHITTEEERRQIILRGIKEDHSTTKIAKDMGVRKGTVMYVLRSMRINKDPDLKQAYIDKETRVYLSTQQRINKRNERFHKMTGKTFKEKNFENMINYYRAELRSVYKSGDEHEAIKGLSDNIRRTLKRNDIITKIGSRIKLTGKARDYLGLN